MLGFVAASFLSDRIGGKPPFYISVLSSIVMVRIYLLAPLGTEALFWLGFPLGFVLHDMWPPMGPFMTELFPTEVRGTAQSFCYNTGSGLGALVPALLGFLAARMSLAAPSSRLPSSPTA